MPVYLPFEVLVKIALYQGIKVVFRPYKLLYASFYSLTYSVLQ